MYNRYIPQSDGSYRRSKVPEKKPESPKHTVPPTPQDFCEAAPPCPPPTLPEKPRQHKAPPTGSSVDSFLRQLLPQDFDTGDLLVILLLLLMAGDCKEEKNTALLTLALYLFM